MKDPKKIDELLTRGVAEVIDCEHLKKRLLTNPTSIRVKFGIDPTSPDIHIGRAVALLKLRDFQDLGCQVAFIVGDFTGQIGDASDKDSERPMLSKTLVEKNMKTYLDQAFEILERKKTKIFYNSLWLADLNLDYIGRMATWFSLAEFISRENIKKRLKTGTRVSLREVLYPLMQGYDSVMLDADVEIGGTDQKFNMLAGRELQRHAVDILSKKHSNLMRKNISEAPKQRSGHSVDYNPLIEKPQDILMMNLIEGTDGRKMSSSWGNTVNLTDAPDRMFEKIMKIPDVLIIKYFVHCTRVPMKAIEKREKDMQSGTMNPRDVKLELATEIVKIYHKERKARKAHDKFINFHHDEEFEDAIPSLAPGWITLVDWMVLEHLAASKSDARRKIEQGGVSVGGNKIKERDYVLGEWDDGKVIRVGKLLSNSRKFIFEI